MRMQRLCYLALAGLLAVGTASTALASSHREAPFTSAHPSIDGTDWYMFMAYGSEPADDVVLIANYYPFQSPYAGPNYFPLNENALYEIKIDNNGNAKPDITFQFRFKHIYKNLAVPAGNGVTNPVPVLNIGQIMAGDNSKLNRIETYTVDVVHGDPRSGNAQPLTDAATGRASFVKPVDYIGEKSLPDYESYAQQYMYDVNIPGCDKTGKVFVGQRKEGFAINVGEIFDLINTNPLGPVNGTENVLADKNVTTIAMEVPKECLTRDASHPIIGGWTTANLRQAQVLNPQPQNETDATINGGAWTQVSRVGDPLVNEVIIGLPDKNKFNDSPPMDDAQFLKYVTNPTLPVLVHTLFPQVAVPATPRNDLVTVFLTGVPGLNQPANVTPSEEMRLNTSIPAVDAGQQNNLGVLGGDKAGFPNGRRPGDDVTDVELRVALGALCGKAGNCGNETTDPNHGAPFTDGATHHATDFLTRFPYLNPPIPGSPNSARKAASQDTDNAGGN